MDDMQISRQTTGNTGRYAIAMPDGSEARLVYSRPDPDHVVASSTFVPPAWRGRKIAERLVARLIDDARAEGFRITPTCWFVADEFDRHVPDWDDLRFKA